MVYGAIDLHTLHSQIRFVDDDGVLVEDMRIPTTRDRLTSVFSGRATMKVLLEASTESEWVAQHLESLGHEVVVADPNYTLMYATRSRRVKTDKRDVAALADACRLGIYRPSHRRSPAHRRLRRQLQVRDHLIRLRTKTINLVRAQLRAEGVRLRSGVAQTFKARVEQATGPEDLAQDLKPALRLVTLLLRLTDRADGPLARRARQTPTARRLMTVPGVGPITALTFMATVDTPERFATVSPPTSYLGLVPVEYSSGEQQRRGRISRSGDPTTRGLLVQAAWSLLRTHDPGAEPLKKWLRQVSQRRGRRIAIVALARRLARILFALWRDDSVFDGRRLELATLTARAV